MPLTDDEVISQLKRHWNTTSLTFEAEFHVPKNEDGSFRDFKGGYFCRFNIPGRHHNLRYPSEEMGISFRYREGNGLTDGKRYKVSLVPETAGRRTQNPLLLRIGGVSEIPKRPDPVLRQDTVEVFYGQYRIFQDGRPCFAEIMFKNSEAILINKKGTRALAFLQPEQAAVLKEHAFYEFTARFNHDPHENLRIKVDINSIIKCTVNPYLNVVQSCHDRMDNPVANRMLANMMREIGKGLYSSRQRMVFELLQNADDTPAGPDLVFNLGVAGDYLTVYHNGQPFSGDDVRAITSAAQSTKRADAAKTGYKGIGFKSVFTETDEVLVRSGGFRFMFLRNHPSFEDFDEFYFDREDYRIFEGLKERNLKKYSQERQSFNSRNDIPWQMIPHWEDNVPPVIFKTGKAGIHSNVFFAIGFGWQVVAEYLKAIEVFAVRPHFMLFLRNVSEFNAPDLKVIKSGERPVTITRTSKNEVSAISYLKRRFTGITISDEAFKAENIGLFKKQEENRYGSVNYFFTDANGKIEETIPPKLAEFDETVLTLAVPVIDGVLQAEPDYLSGAETSCIYTYLPMNEGRIRLPFLVNADFVPSSDREELQGDNPWNAFVSAKIAICHVAWLEELALQAAENIHAHRKYLSLLLKEPLPENFAVTRLVDKYNEAYLGVIVKAAFILSDKNKVIRADETVLDQTGVSDFDGGALFYQLSGEKRSLPNPGLEHSYLSAACLNITSFTDGLLLNALAGSDSVAPVSGFLQGAGQNVYRDFMGWLDGFLSRTGKPLSSLPLLPFVRKKDQVLNLADALADTTLLIKVRKLEPAEKILEQADLVLTEFYLDDYPALFAEFQNGVHYLAKNERLFERIAGAPALTSLSPDDKNALLVFLAALPGVGDKRYAGELKLFIAEDKSGPGRALKEMTFSSVTVRPRWLKDRIIAKAEEQVLHPDFKAFLVSEEDIITKLLASADVFGAIVAGLNQEEFSGFYDYLAAAALKVKKEDLDVFQSVACLFTDAKNKFMLPGEVFYVESLGKLTAAKYSSISKATSALSGAVLPDQSAASFIKEAGLNCRNELRVTTAAVLEVGVLRDFLSWHKDKQFFETVSISIADIGCSVGIDSGTVQYYNAEPALQELIDAEAEAKGMQALPASLWMNGLEDLGLLAGNGLLEWMVANGFAVPGLAVFIGEAKNGVLALSYLNALEALELDDESEYGPDTPEHVILDLLINQSGADDAYLKAFSKRITINGNTLAGYNVSDRVAFKFKDENNRLDRHYELSLSDILPVYKNSARTVSSVLDNITELNRRNILRDKIFSAEEKPLKHILEEIHVDAKEFLTTWQIFFLLLYLEKFPTEDVWGEKDDFAGWFKDKDEAKYKKLCLKMMNIFYEKDYYLFLEEFSFGGVLNDKLIAGSELTVSDEHMPGWLGAWLVEGAVVKKTAFLVRAGLQGPGSQVVLLRDAMQQNKKLQFEKSLVMLEDSGQLSRSLAWLTGNQEAVSLPLTAEFLKPLYKKCELLGLKTGDIPVPVMTSAEDGNYRLIYYDDTKNVHLKNSGWNGYEKEVFDYISAAGGEVIDDLMPAAYAKAFAQVIEVVAEEPDAARLKAGSSGLGVDFYQEWPEKDSQPVMVYRGGDLPGQAIYYKEVIKNMGYGSFAECESTYYIRHFFDLHELMFLLRQVLPDGAMNSLWRFREEYEEGKRREQQKANYTEEELSALERMFGNDVPGSFLKDLNMASLVKGLFYLKDKGYDVSEAEKNLPVTHQYSNLSPVYPPGNGTVPATVLTVSCRSAKGGLLFLTAKAWKNLAAPQSCLYILTGNSFTDGRFCRNRDEIMNDRDDFQLMRIRSGNKASTIDDILDGKGPAEDVTLVIRMKKSDRYDSVFEDVFKKQRRDTAKGAQVDNEDLY